MELTIRPTESIIKLDGRHVRVWDGVAEPGGAKCLVFVAMVAVPLGEDATPFDRRLCGLADPRSIEPDDVPDLARYLTGNWEPPE